jgi:hypothetical protein
MAFTLKQTTKPNTGKALFEHKRQMSNKFRKRISDMNATKNGSTDENVNWGDGYPKDLD